ncbi:hypothetical protein PAXRUDRAFT_149899, partial [Paxillus rubicundulus Ve08.2h10]
DNTVYNYYVSKVRIQSEHAMGYLKGTWQSLQGLHVHIDQEAHIQYACIHLHSFVLGHQQDINILMDSFFHKGQQIIDDERAWDARKLSAAKKGC